MHMPKGGMVCRVKNCHKRKAHPKGSQEDAPFPGHEKTVARPHRQNDQKPWDRHVMKGSECLSQIERNQTYDEQSPPQDPAPPTRLCRRGGHCTLDTRRGYVFGSAISVRHASVSSAARARETTSRFSTARFASKKIFVVSMAMPIHLIEEPPPISRFAHPKPYFTRG